MTDCLLVMTTLPELATAKQLGHLLVEHNLSACTSIIPSITSIYRWKDIINEETEYLLLIKTQAVHYQAIETFLRHHHPYQVPEIIAVPITQGLAAYLGWIKESTLA